MHELVIISGRGGSGKTSLAAALASLAGPVVLADCDVDSAALPRLLSPSIQHRHPFKSGHLAVIWQNRCIRCGGCLTSCQFDAVRQSPGEADEATFAIDPFSCEGCGECVEYCPVHAIGFPEQEGGEWYVSETSRGTMVHAQLQPGADNTGKLVAQVRKEARRQAEAARIDRILIDGPAGLGYPVRASITGASQVLVVSEPSATSEDDLTRALDVAAHLEVPAAICLNKWDLDPAQARRLADLAARRKAPVLARIPYDPALPAAQLLGQGVCHTNTQTPAATAIHQLWEAL